MFLGEWCNVAISYYVQFFPNPDQFLVVVEDGVFIFQLLFCINFCVIWCDADPWFCGSVSKSGVWCIIPLHRCASVIPGMNRSEERRVGKECSSRWSADTDKKNG